MYRLSSVVVLCVLAACTSNPEVGYHKDIAPIMQRSCVGCHQEGNIAPFVLDDYESVKNVKELVKESVVNRTMPPWLAEPGCAEYVGDPSLSQTEIDTIVAWVDDNAPEGAKVETPVSELVDIDLDRVDITLRLDEYAPQGRSDVYRCFPIEWPQNEEGFAVGFGVAPENLKIAHHAIAYVANPDQAAEVRALDDAEEGPGYTCFGGPGFGGVPRWLGAWAPGSPPVNYPEGTGLRMVPGSMVVLQMHYFMGGNVGQSDRVQIDVKMESAVDKEAIIIPYTNPTWPSGGEMVIPAGSTTTAHTFSVKLSSFSDEPILLYNANAHMHRLGKGTAMWIDRASGERECLLNITNWDFDWQLTYGFVEPKVVFPEDTLSLECLWDNSPANQPTVDGQISPPRDVDWGDGTGDEMCLGIFYVTTL